MDKRGASILPDLTAKVKKLARSNEMDYAGVASVERFKNAPDGRKPTDFLKNCKSVVSMGVRIGKGVSEAHRSAYEGVRRAIYVYMAFGYDSLNDRMNFAALRLARFLESQGFSSTPIPASVPMDHYEIVGAFSHRHAAVAAGLGEFGWHNLLVTPDWGPRVRVVTVLTEANLKPDPVFPGQTLCDKENCGKCVSVCPMNAISRDEGVEVEIGDRVFKYAKLKKTRCRFGTMGFSTKTLGRRELNMPEDPQPQDYLTALQQEDPWQRMERLSPGFCGRCMMNCPIPK